jgi:hypothetical protein
MKRLKLALLGTLCIALLSVNGQGQARRDDPDETSLNDAVKPNIGDTALSALWNRRNALLHKGYSDLGTISADDGSTLRVRLLQLRTMGTSDKPDKTDKSDKSKTEQVDKADGVSIQLTRQNGRSVESFLDTTQLDAVAQALDTIRKMDKNSTTLNDFEARYRADGGLEIANVDVEGAHVAEIRCTQILAIRGEIISARAFLRPARLDELKRLLTSAKDKIDQINKEANAKHY